jgi:hypothetical protein
VKRSNLGGVYNQLFGVTTGTNNSSFLVFCFGADGIADTLGFQGWSSSSYRTTTQVFRDVSAWYHIVLAVDTTQATAADRIKLYVNGVEVTTFSSNINPGLNADLLINSTATHTIGRDTAQNTNFDGYLANIHFIDGQALTPSSFTTTDATTGQLIPIIYTGSYGTNGFYLEFSDNSSNTASTLGKDYSGLGNNWTPNNLSVTAGAGNDSLVDSPTNYGTDTGVGGEVRGNYCTLNLLALPPASTMSNGNLDISTSTGWLSYVGTIAMNTGKWYWEYQLTSGPYAVVGVRNDITTAGNPPYISGAGYYSLSGAKESQAGGGVPYGASWNSSNIIGIAFDADAGTITFYRDNVSQGQAFSNLTSGPYYPNLGLYQSGGTFNFGQRAFAYTAPSGFKALCTQNLPAPLVTKSNTVMDVALYTGNGGTQSITGLAFSPDFVWLKARSSSGYAHILQDIIRGAGKTLATQNTAAESGNAGDLISSFNSDGFTVNNTYLGGSAPDTNGSGTTFVGWTWDAGTSTVSNTQGSITSQVRANATAGFSVCTFTQPSSSSSFSWGHGLNVAPQLAIMKPRDTSGNWQVYHASTGAQYLWLNDTAAATGTGWSTVNSSIVTATASLWAGSNVTTVAYCFAPVVGYSSFGSYTGNGSTDGPMVYTGMRPRWVLIKSSSAAGESWFLFDTSRSPYNVSQEYLQPNSSAAEASAYTIMDILSNGFKLKTSGGGSAFNGSGATYIYAAFAEMPFNYSRAR